MADVFKIADIIVENAKAKYADDISIIAYYGSYAAGTATVTSDMDFFFIPRTREAHKASIQFILDRIGFDFWPISWERAGKIASFDTELVSVIAESRVLYSRSDDELARFNGLREKIALLCKPENRTVMIGKAVDNIGKCYIHLYNMKECIMKNDPISCRFEALKVTKSVMFSLALLNQTYFSTGWGKSMNEVLSLPLKPKNLKELLDGITLSADCIQIMKICDKLVSSTKSLILTEQKNTRQDVTYSSIFNGYFEEVKSSFNKIISACDHGDQDTAIYTAHQVQHELSSFLKLSETGINSTNLNIYADFNQSYHNFNFPDLFTAFTSDGLDGLKMAVIELEEKMRRMLINKEVHLNEFRDTSEFEHFLHER